MKVLAIRRGTPAGSATYAASYRSGTNIDDHHVTGKAYIHSWRTDIEATQIVPPSQFANKAGMEWLLDRSKLWNRVERAEPVPSREGHTKESYKKILRTQRVAWDIVAKTTEHLNPRQRLDAALKLAQHIADRHQVVVDVALHRQRLGRARFNHFHMLLSARQVTADGFGRMAQVDFKEIRQAWKGLLTEAMKEAGYGLAETRPYFTFSENGEEKKKYWARLLAEGFDRKGQRREDNAKKRPDRAQKLATKLRRQAIPELRVKFNPTTNTQQGTRSASQKKAKQGGLEAWMAHRRAEEGAGSKQTEETASKSLGKWMASQTAAQQESKELAEESLRRWMAYRQKESRNEHTEERSVKSLRTWMDANSKRESQAQALAAQPGASKEEQAAGHKQSLGERVREESLRIWMAYRNSPDWAKNLAASLSLDTGRKRDYGREISYGYGM